MDVTTHQHFVVSCSFLTTFHCCDKTSGISNLKGGEVNFGSWFQRFPALVRRPHCFGAWVEPEHHGGEAAHLIEAGGQKDRAKGQGPSRPPRAGLGVPTSCSEAASLQDAPHHDQWHPAATDLGTLQIQTVTRLRIGLTSSSGCAAATPHPPSVTSFICPLDSLMGCPSVLVMCSNSSCISDTNAVLCCQYLLPICDLSFYFVRIKIDQVS